MRFLYLYDLCYIDKIIIINVGLGVDGSLSLVLEHEHIPSILDCRDVSRSWYSTWDLYLLILFLWRRTTEFLRKSFVQRRDKRCTFYLFFHIIIFTFGIQILLNGEMCELCRYTPFQLQLLTKYNHFDDHGVHIRLRFFFMKDPFRSVLSQGHWRCPFYFLFWRSYYLYLLTYVWEYVICVLYLVCIY